MSVVSLLEKHGGAPDAKDTIRLELKMLTCAALIERRVGARLRESFGATLPRFDFLAALDRGGELSLGEVGRLLMVTGGNITGLAHRLRQDGLIESSQGRGDRRVQYVRLTERGAEQFRAMAAAHEGWIEELFADLSGAERHQLLALLERAKRSLQRPIPEDV